MVDAAQIKQLQKSKQNQDNCLSQSASCPHFLYVHALFSAAAHLNHVGGLLSDCQRESVCWKQRELPLPTASFENVTRKIKIQSNLPCVTHNGEFPNAVPRTPNVEQQSGLSARRPPALHCVVRRLFYSGATTKALH